MAMPLLSELLAIPSPTGYEKDKADFLQAWVSKHLPNASMIRRGNGLLIDIPSQATKSVAFVGHIDTVPSFFTPYKKDGKYYGSGASDMQAGLATLLGFVYQYQQELLNICTIKIVIYDKEEGTPIHENGLYALLQHVPEWFDAIDVAIVGEPTDNAIQLGCVGSLHYTLTVAGVAAHSARPWHGENALYNALPIISKVAEAKPTEQHIFGVRFYDVLSITESASSRGRTTIPDEWVANINYRFSPVHTMDDAKSYVETFVHESGLKNYTLTVLNEVDAGQVVDHPWLQSWCNSGRYRIEAKQAWTDVAQLTKRGICAVNFGAGRQDQAHQPNEYVVEADIHAMHQMLYTMFIEEVV